MEDEYPQPKQRPINISILNAIISHSRKNVKQESNASQGDTSSSSQAYDEKLDNIMAFVQDISTKLLASQLSCTFSIPDLRQSLPLSKLNWIKSKGSYKKMMTGYSMKKGGNGNHDRGRAMIGRES